MRFALGRGLKSVTVLLLPLFVLRLSGAQVQDEAYRLRPDDVVTLTVIRHPEWSGDLFVPADGVIDLPFAGPTKVAGLTTVQMRTIIVAALDKRIYHAEAIVVLKVPSTRRVYVEGNVKQAAAVDYKPGWRIAQALSEAGGLADGIQPIDVRVSVLSAATGKVAEYALADILAGGNQSNVPVYPGDVVTFTAQQSVPVYITGQVSKPGMYPVRLDDANLMSAISLAGGVLPTAATNSITVTHLNGTHEVFNLTPAIVNGEKTPMPELRSGDLVVVPELTSRFVVTGLVKLPGVFPLPDGKLVRLSEAIGLAGGDDPHRARTTKVAILRNDNGKMTKLVVNYAAFRAKGDFTQDPLVQAGDVIYVPETNSWDFTTVFNALVGAYYIVNTVNLVRHN